MRRLGWGVQVVALAALVIAAVGRCGAQEVMPGVRVGFRLAIASVGRGGRTPVHTDALEAQIVAGTWTRPKAGDTIALPDGKSRTWETVTPDKDGNWNGPALNGGYAYMAVEADTERVVMLEAVGDSMVYVNGEPRPGDPYEYGWLRLPILLHRGTNDLLFQCGRGHLRVRLNAITKPIAIETADATLPDIIRDEQGAFWASVVVTNATTRRLTGLTLAANSGNSTIVSALPTVEPLTARKIGFQIPSGMMETNGKATLNLRLLKMDGAHPQVLDTRSFTLRVRSADETHKRTFVSDIDGSVQYYGVNPARPIGKRTGPLALFLTLHGASVEAIGQAEAYEAKTWGDLIAPTNRRPYGFDWEDWGRLDALEVLNEATKRFHPDPRRIFLMGHSMGGHGTWQVGATFPDKFAAIGPSAGWISFNSYVNGPQTAETSPVSSLLRRAASPSDTLALAPNYAQEGVYIIHGDADDNVPVTEARTMAKTLGAFHRDWTYHEQPGAGHWWDVSPEPGADCVDWLPLFDFFGRHARPDSATVRQIDFVTASPGVSATCHWITICNQLHDLQLSKVSARCDPGLRRYTITTDNISRLAIDSVSLPPGKPVNIEIDGQKLESVFSVSKWWLNRVGDRWQVEGLPSPSLKNPGRYGPFKLAFTHRACLVYGTKGTPAENAWAYAKARYDAETFWYRGNGAFDVLPDTAFDARHDLDRSVILYGNAETNGAWSGLLANSPVQITRRAVVMDGKATLGDNLACLFLRPRPGSAIAAVGVVGGTGLAGMRLSDRLPTFVSGVAYPDCTVFGPEILTQGEGGVRVAGFFGDDWSAASGEWAVNPAPKQAAQVSR